MKKAIVVSFLAGALFATASTGFAQESISKVQAILAGNVKVQVNGQQATLQNTPLQYNGSVYLPIRDAAKVLGTNVSWNQAKQTVSLTSDSSSSSSNNTSSNSSSSDESTGYIPLINVYQNIEAKGCGMVYDEATSKYALVKYTNPLNQKEYDVLLNDVPYTVQNGRTAISISYYTGTIVPALAAL